MSCTMLLAAVKSTTETGPLCNQGFAFTCCKHNNVTTVLFCLGSRQKKHVYATCDNWRLVGILKVHPFRYPWSNIFSDAKIDYWMRMPNHDHLREKLDLSWPQDTNHAESNWFWWTEERNKDKSLVTNANAGFTKNTILKININIFC